MKFIEGIPREQAIIFEGCLDNAIEPDNEVRGIDAFVHSINSARVWVYDFELCKNEKIATVKNPPLSIT